MLAAMTTGHDGSLSTVHAGSPAEALRRLETLALMPVSACRTRRSASRSPTRSTSSCTRSEGPTASAESWR
jgi:Flp pilus assembly CpaF family ATPase